MQFGYDPSKRYRRRSAERRRKAIMLTVLVLAAGLFGYWLGKTATDSAAEAWRVQAEKLEAENTALVNRSTALMGRVQEGEIRLAHTEGAAGQNPAVKELIKLLNKQLGRGLEPERLGRIIQAARPARNCTRKEVKQALVNTENYKGPVTEIRFADDFIGVSARGMAAVDEAGKAAAWFDAAKPVTLSFTTQNGFQANKSALLPFEHSVISGNREYRFSVATGPQSFIEIAADNCSYP